MEWKYPHGRSRLLYCLLTHPWVALALLLSAALLIRGEHPPPRSSLDLSRVVRLEGIVRVPWQVEEGYAYTELGVTSIVQHGRQVAYSGRVALHLHQDQPPFDHPALRYGRKLRIVGFLREARYYAVPGVEDQRRESRRRGVSYRIHLKSVRQIEVGEADSPRILRVLFAYRRSFLEFARERLSEKSRQLVLASFLGEYRQLDASETDQIAQLGVVHLFVVSGFHVSLVVALLHLLTSRLPWGRSLLVLAGLSSYVLLVGSTHSVLRAALMTGAVYLGLVLGLPGTLLNTLGLAVTILLCLWPQSIFVAGFRFSVLSLVCLALVASPFFATGNIWIGGVRRLFTEDAELDPTAGQGRYFLEEWLQFLPRQPTMASVKSMARLGGPVVNLLASGVWIQLTLLPLLLSQSNRVVWLQALCNVVLAPMITVLVPLSLALFLLHWSALGGLLVPVVELATESLLWVLQSAASESWVSYFPAPGGNQTLLYLATLLLGTLFGKRLPRFWALVPALALLLSLSTGHHADGGILEITLLDVGQGDAAHIRYPDGRSVMIDCGGQGLSGENRSRYLAERVIGRYLLNQHRIDRLEFILLSHPHLDHIGSLPYLARMFKIGRLYYHQPDRRYQRLIPRQVVSAGERFAFSGVDHLFLHPEEGQAGTTNDQSLVVRLQYGAFSMLFSGDIERSAERSLGDRLEPVTLLKVPHHGGRTSSTLGFLNPLRPQIAVISAGRRNAFGHPAPETLNRLSTVGAQVITTAEDGSIILRTDGRTLSIWRYRDEETQRVGDPIQLTWPGAMPVRRND